MSAGGELLRVSEADRPGERQAGAGEASVDEVGPQWDISQASAEGAGEVVEVRAGPGYEEVRERGRERFQVKQLRAAMRRHPEVVEQFMTEQTNAQSRRDAHATSQSS